MQNSVIFLKKGKTFDYINYDCCERLGTHFMENSHKVMYVGLPVAEMDEFFMQSNNLQAYLDFLTTTFDIRYTILDRATEDVSFNLGSCAFGKEDEFIYVKVEVTEHYSNKYFNTAYNCLRYLWYKQYTNMAIIATNLFKLGIINEPMDILAIATSYQTTNGRAILPNETASLPGLLFFRPKVDVVRELVSNVNFNNVFYKFPIYFDPSVTVRGSFFSDVSSVIKAKEVISKLVGVMDVDDIPSFMRNNIKLIYDDYQEMREFYLYLLTKLTERNFVISKDNPVLLKKGTKTLTITAISPTGYPEKVTFSTPSSIVEEQKTFVDTSLPF